MKLHFILLSFVLTLFSSQVFSYVVYNQSSNSYYVSDIHHRGMRVTIPAYSSAACDPKSKGCSGDISFYVYHSDPDNTLGCRWTGTLDNGKGYYFIISPTGQSSPLDSCTMELYRNQ